MVIKDSSTVTVTKKWLRLPRIQSHGDSTYWPNFLLTKDVNTRGTFSVTQIFKINYQP